MNWVPFYDETGGKKRRPKTRKRPKRNASLRNGKKGGGTRHSQNYEENLGYFGPIMDPKTGKLNRDEICHNCTVGAYEKGARRFCKTHGKVWDRKSNSCKAKKGGKGKSDKKRAGKKRAGKKKTKRLMKGGGGG